MQEGNWWKRASRDGWAALMWLVYSCRPPVELRCSRRCLSLSELQCSPSSRSKDFLHRCIKLARIAFLRFTGFTFLGFTELLGFTAFLRHE